MIKILVTLDTSIRYTNKSEMISQTKPFIAFLNRSSGIKRGQPHNIYYNINKTAPKDENFWGCSLSIRIDSKINP